jgi:hypothetical protein
MRCFHRFAVAATAVMFMPALAALHAQDSTRKVAGGGISVAGWMGKADATRESQGQTVDDAKFIKMGDGFHIVTGPGITYWNPANKASGNYTVKATFQEPKYMDLNNHPHPYGIMIAGNDLGTDQASYLYCSAYGNGSFLVRGFGVDTATKMSKVFNVSGRMGTPNDAVHKAAGKGEPVTQEIALSVKGDKVECAVNGTVVASYSKSELVTAGKLKSTDGVYGLRFGHNTEAMVTGFKMTKE